MIAAVLAVLLGQAVPLGQAPLLGATTLLGWCAAVPAINCAHFPRRRGA
jgi:hypothetical protein